MRMSGNTTSAIGCALLALGGLAYASSACAEQDPMREVPQGTWGGRSVRLTVAESGAAIEFDCAHGSIEGPLRLEDGKFDVAGVFVRERGGPVRRGEKPDKRPARYFGSTDGRALTLNVTLTEEDQTLGPFTLRRGASGKLFKCL